MKTTTQLLDSVRQGISVPEYQSRFSDVTLLSMADDILMAKICPIIVNINQELMVVTQSVPVTGSTRYLVPSRAMGRSLRYIRYDDKLLSFISPEDVQIGEIGTPRAVSFEGECYMPYPTPTTGVMTVAYMARHSQLVKADQAALISSVNTGSNSVLCSNIPSGIVAGVVVDVVGDCQGLDITVVSVNSNVIELSSLPDGVKAGSYVCLSGQSATINIPEELYPALSKGIQMRILEAQGEIEAYSVTAKEFMDCLDAGKSLIAPRLVNSIPKMKCSPFYNRSKRWR